MKKIIQNKIICFINSKIYYFLIVTYILYAGTIGVLSSQHLPGGIRFFTNQYSSMEPVINSGSLTMVISQSYYDAGDIITYYAKGTDGKEEIVTHRIRSIGGNVYVTKGDANMVDDRELVLPRLVIGKVTKIIPNLGHVVSFAKSQFGVIATIIAPAVIFIFIEVLKILRLYIHH